MSSETVELNAVNEIACLLIPTADNNLILPNVSVAEIVGYLHPMTEDDAPDWFLGMVSWRNQEVPLLSYEVLNGQARPEFVVANRLAILNNTGIDEDLAWIAIIAQSTPRLMRVGQEEVAEVESETLRPAELMVVTVNGEDAIIPNLEYLQNRYLEFRAGQ